MLKFCIYRLTAILLLIFLIATLSGCGEDAFTVGNTNPVVDASQNRIPEMRQAPDCDNSIAFDTGASNGFGLQKIVNIAELPTDSLYTWLAVRFCR